MKNILNYITERLRLSKSSEDKYNGEVILDTNSKKQAIVSNDDLYEIKNFAEKLPIPPKEIKIGRNGNIKLLWDKIVATHFNKPKYFSINISKPERYEGSFQIRIELGKYMPYEYPMGSNNNRLKNGNLALPDIKSIFDKINEQWNKRNLTNSLK